jgi:acyl-CoA thioesterase-2
MIPAAPRDLTYASDHTLLGVILRPHGRTFMSSGPQWLPARSHAVVPSRVRADEWLYEQVTPAAFGGRGLALGRFYTRPACSSRRWQRAWSATAHADHP